jgi:hypothetical protein
MMRLMGEQMFGSVSSNGWNALVAIGTLCLAIVALIAVFFDSFRNRFNRPRLAIRFDLGVPDFMLSTYVAPKRTGPEDQPIIATAYYLRFRVRNEGRNPAENVEAFIGSVKAAKGAGVFESLTHIFPLNLCWSNVPIQRGSQNIFYPRVNPRLDKHCNLGYIIDPKSRGYFTYKNEQLWVTEQLRCEGKAILSLDTIEKPSGMTGLSPPNLLSPGTYRTEVVVVASNAKAVSRVFEITITGDWTEDYEEMLRDGISVRLVNSKIDKHSAYSRVPKHRLKRDTLLRV